MHVPITHGKRLRSRSHGIRGLSSKRKKFACRWQSHQNSTSFPFMALAFNEQMFAICFLFFFSYNRTRCRRQWSGEAHNHWPEQQRMKRTIKYDVISIEMIVLFLFSLCGMFGRTRADFVLCRVPCRSDSVLCQGVVSFSLVLSIRRSAKRHSTYMFFLCACKSISIALNWRRTSADIFCGEIYIWNPMDFEIFFAPWKQSRLSTLMLGEAQTTFVLANCEEGELK